MDKKRYLKKKEELKDKYPNIMKKSFMFKVRIVIFVVGLIVVKLIQGGLPKSNITCLQDNVVNYYKTFQNNFTESMFDILKIIFFIIIILNLLLLALQWVLKCTNIRLPVTIVLFYIIKFIIDLTLFVKKPKSKFHKDLFIYDYKFNLQTLFLSNVDTYSGILFISFLYFISSKEKLLFKLLYLIFVFLSFVFVFNFLLLFQLSYTFSIFSALFVSLFSDIIAKDIDRKYKKYIFKNKDVNNTDLEI